MLTIAIRGLVFFYAMCVSSVVLTDGYYNGFTIQELQYAAGATGVQVVYSGGTGNPNPDACPTSGRFIAAYTSTTPERERAMLTGLAVAFTAGKTVRVYLNGCGDAVSGNSYPLIRILFVER